MENYNQEPNYSKTGWGDVDFYFNSDFDKRIKQVNAFLDDERDVEALEYVSKILERFPNNSEVYHLMGVIYSRSQLRDSLKALHYWNKSIDLDPGNIDVYINRARMYFNVIKGDECKNLLSLLN